MAKKCGYGDMWQNIKNLGAERTVTKKCKENIFMKREDLKAKGYTDEQIDHILDEFHIGFIY